MFCQKCGTQIPDGELVCPQCGALQGNAKFCKHCGQAIDGDCVVCPKCGKQVEELKQEQQQPIVINNTNTNTNVATAYVEEGRRRRPINKWVSFVLCLFLGYVGAHKFYEGKIGMGFLYLFTVGLFGIGWIVDCVRILLKPNPYYIS